MNSLIIFSKKEKVIFHDVELKNQVFQNSSSNPGQYCSGFQRLYGNVQVNNSIFITGEQL